MSTWHRPFRQAPCGSMQDVGCRCQRREPMGLGVRTFALLGCLHILHILH